MFLVGESGTGKSTSLKWLHQQLISLKVESEKKVLSILHSVAGEKNAQFATVDLVNPERGKAP